MQQVALAAAGIVLVLALPPAGAAQADAADEPIAPERKIELFNGRDLAGWTTWLVDTRDADPRGVYGVRDGQIRISGDGFGYLSTRRSYRDYRLVVEFKWGERNWRGRERNARDSGIFLHAVGPDGNSFDGNGAYRAAIECQVMQGAVGDFLLIKGRDERGAAVPVRLTARAAERRDADGWPTWDPRGTAVTLRGTGRLNWQGKDPDWRDVLDFRGKRDVESPGGEWTRVECVCPKDTIRISVNGSVVNEATEVFPSAGRILLQCEGSEILFRRVELHPLDADSGKSPLAP